MLRHRLKNEGTAFLTVTLPKLSKAVLRSLELGYFERPTCFAWKGRSLRHFRSLLNGIFDQKDGTVLAKVDEFSLYRLRQLCEYAYKLALPFTDEQLDLHTQKYKNTEDELAALPLDNDFIDKMRKNFHTHYKPISDAVPKDVFEHSRPRFTSGSFSGSTELPKTFRHFAVYKQLPSSVIGLCNVGFAPYSGYFKSYPSSSEQVLPKDETGCSEVLFVPKDSRGPRVISKEPLLSLKGQMAYFDWLSSSLEKVTNRRVNFRDQQINRNLAATASKDLSMATLDLKDASDRLTYKLCLKLFVHAPACRYFIHKRVNHTKLPNGEVIYLNKLAGMGSGLTFATMALCIHLAVVTEIQLQHSWLDFRDISKQVYVYGDDLIVPVCYYDCARNSLRKIGLLVNDEKSYVFSKFRESCGGDFYNGVDVGITRLKLTFERFKSIGRHLCFSNLKSACLKLERHCRELISNGMISLAEYYYTQIESVLGKLPLVRGETAFLGRYSWTGTYPEDSTGNFLPVKAWIPLPSVVEDQRLCPYKALGSRLREVSYDYLSYLDKVAGGSATEVALPREIRLVKREVSALALLG
jgi:hypothetical protein